MFRCKVCAEKSSRIEDLKKEIDYLRSFAFPEQPRLSARHLEADAVLSGKQDIITMDLDEPQPSAKAAEDAERDRIFSGSY